MNEENWVHHAVKKIEADYQRSADTHLIKLDIPACPDIHLYLKDESTHPTGSLKHRLARSLFLYGLCNGWVREGAPIIESSSGSTAVSEAYFARLIGVPFIAVIPSSTSPEKIQQIRFYGGDCHFVEPGGDIYQQAAELAKQKNGHYMDQFTYAERATDWRGNNNVAESIFSQMQAEPYPEPEWIVVGAGTGGTSSTIGRYIRYQRKHTKLCVADPESSIFYDFYQNREVTTAKIGASRIEGIGRPRIEPSFNPDVIDCMERVPDEASIASIHFLAQRLHRQCGGSTGTNLYATVKLAKEMVKAGKKGSLVTMICDGGERYLNTYYDEDWIKHQGFDLQAVMNELSTFFDG
jgi:cysteine synthase A